MNSINNLEPLSDPNSDHHHYAQPHPIQPQPHPHPHRPRGFAATSAAAMGVATTTATTTTRNSKGGKEKEKEKERTKLRERHRRAITSRMLAGLRQYGNFSLPARADMNDVLAALAREAGWTVDADGTTYRPFPPSLVGTYPMRSVESPLSASSLKNCSVKASLDCQPSVLRIDESLSSASLDSVVVPERNSEGDKYTSASPINSPQCLEADQAHLQAEQDKEKEDVPNFEATDSCDVSIEIFEVPKVEPKIMYEEQIEKISNVAFELFVTE